MIHRLTVREAHLEFRASSMELKETLSKASSTSRKVPSAIPWLRMENSSCRTSLCTVAMVELPLSLRKPNCFLLRFEYILRSTSMCQSMILSIHFSGTGASVMVHCTKGIGVEVISLPGPATVRGLNSFRALRALFSENMWSRSHSVSCSTFWGLPGGC